MIYRNYYPKLETFKYRPAPMPIETSADGAVRHLLYQLRWRRWIRRYVNRARGTEKKGLNGVPLWQ